MPKASTDDHAGACKDYVWAVGQLPLMQPVAKSLPVQEPAVWWSCDRRSDAWQQDAARRRHAKADCLQASGRWSTMWARYALPLRSGSQYL